MHHVHISTGFMFVAALFIVGFVGVVLAFVASMKADRRAADVAIERAKADAAYRLANPVRPTADDIQRVHGERLEARAAVNGWPMRSASDMRPASIHNGYPMANTYSPVAAAAPVYAHDPLTGLATGMMLGSMMGHSHHDTTTIIERGADPTHTHSYTDSSSSYSPSSSSDSGFSYSSDSSSSYSDSGSSSGFDASW
jgi:ABC-type uncharacterized transport system fused permease/ATPase subunit